MLPSEEEKIKEIFKSVLNENGSLGSSFNYSRNNPFEGSIKEYEDLKNSINDGVKAILETVGDIRKLNTTLINIKEDDKKRIEEEKKSKKEEREAKKKEQKDLEKALNITEKLKNSKKFQGYNKQDQNTLLSHIAPLTSTLGKNVAKFNELSNSIENLKKVSVLYAESQSRILDIKRKWEQQYATYQAINAEQFEKNREKNEAINYTKYVSKQKAETTRLKGYTDDGRERAGKETRELLGRLREETSNSTKGRLIAKSAAKAFNVGDKAMGAIQNEELNVSSIANSISGSLSKLGPWGMAAGAVVNIVSKAYEMYKQLNVAASKYVREVGGGEAAMFRMQRNISDAAREMNRLGGRAYTAHKLLETMAEYSKSLGRNIEYISRSDLRALQDLKDFGVDNSSILVFDTLGKSLNSVSERLAALYGESGKRGLNAKVVQETMLKNLKMAQNYNFARGVDALSKMAQKSVELKINMESVGKFADKVSTLEGSLKSAASLSVLGGSFSRNANPLSFLYESLNDVESLQNRLMDITNGIAKWDESKKQFEISAFNRQRLRAAAEPLGVDYGELVNQSLNQARRKRVEEQLSGRRDLKDDTIEYIKNIATFDNNGNAVVTLDGIEKQVKDLSELDKRRLQAESQAKDEKRNANIGNILEKTRNVEEKLNDLTKWAKGPLTQFISKIAHMSEERTARAYGITDEHMDDYKKVKKQIQNPNNLYRPLTEAERELYQYIGVLKTDGEVNKKLLKEFADNKELLAEKLSEYFDNLDEKNQNKKANGGIVIGNGTKYSDSISARLSNGEFVVNADSTSKNLGLLNTINNSKDSIIKPTDNQYSSIAFKNRDNGKTENIDQINRSDNVDLNLNASGSIKLIFPDGNSKNIMVKDLINDNYFIDQMIKMISIRTGYALDRDNTHQKFG